MKVMLVEDDDMIQRMYGRVMRQDGLELVGVNNGTLALDTALREKPDVIVMDVMMPEMNGMDALRILKANEQTKGIPVIMLSAYEDDALLIGAMNAGAKRYLLKSSMEPEQLLDVIKQVAAGA